MAATVSISVGSKIWSRRVERRANRELRGCFGDLFTTEEEEVLDNNPPGVLEFVNSVGLVAPGSRAFYKVYVKLTTGNGWVARISG